jgi:hypothetical protein
MTQLTPAGSYKVLRIIHGAMFASVLVFAAVVYYLDPPVSQTNALLFNIFLAVGAALFAFALLLRKKYLKQAEQEYGPAAPRPEQLQLRQAGYIVAFALAEAIALNGFVLRVLGYSWAQSAPFFIASILLFVLLLPRAAESDTR